MEKTIQDIRNIINLIKEKQNKTAKKAYLYVIPKELGIYNECLEGIKTNTGIEIEAFANNDSGIYDPEKKAGKAKPEKPAVYIE